MTPPPRIVLDTNVCLDLFVFREPLCSHLLSALQRGAVQAVTREDCRDEWRRVLHYPQLPIDAARRLRANAAFDAWVRLLPAQDAVALGFRAQLLWDLSRPVTPDADAATRAALQAQAIGVIEGA